MNRRDLYESTQKQLVLSVKFPFLDVETKWSSTFHIINHDQKAKPILNWITARNKDLRYFGVFDNDWHIDPTVQNILKTAASLTECQSGSDHLTLSMTIKEFSSLETKCYVAINAIEPLLKLIAEKILSNTDKYDVGALWKSCTAGEDT